MAPCTAVISYEPPRGRSKVSMSLVSALSSLVVPSRTGSADPTGFTLTFATTRGPPTRSRARIITFVVTAVSVGLSAGAAAV